MAGRRSRTHSSASNPVKGLSLRAQVKGRSPPATLKGFCPANLFFGFSGEGREGKVEHSQINLEKMPGKEEVKQLEECSVSNALGTWVFSVLGALVAIPVGIKKKSLAPLVFFGTTGTMLDIIMGISACEREHAERQMKLLEEAQNSSTDVILPE
ncbi:hypothetical protein RDABS01_019894 [Bienertia sinuspersici]